MSTTSNALTTFAYEGKPVQTIVREDGSVLFLAADVGDCLGIKNIRETLRYLDDDERADVSIPDSSSGQRRKMVFLTEPGLYRIMATARVEKAKAFQRWVFHEVLPAIRRTGKYEAPQAPSDFDSSYPDSSFYMARGFLEDVLGMVKPSKEFTARLGFKAWELAQGGDFPPPRRVTRTSLKGKEMHFCRHHISTLAAAALALAKEDTLRADRISRAVHSSMKALAHDCR